MNPDRPVSSLLKMQIEHLQGAEKRLPSRYRTDTYVNAIKTEGEAAKYIREVTEAIHRAHNDAARARLAPKRKSGIEIAAVADESSPQKVASEGSKKKGNRKTGRKI
jgi:hypothetical protein